MAAVASSNIVRVFESTLQNAKVMTENMTSSDLYQAFNVTVGLQSHIMKFLAEIAMLYEGKSSQNVASNLNSVWNPEPHITSYSPKLQPSQERRNLLEESLSIHSSSLQTTGSNINNSGSFLSDANILPALQSSSHQRHKNFNNNTTRHSIPHNNIRSQSFNTSLLHKQPAKVAKVTAPSSDMSAPSSNNYNVSSNETSDAIQPSTASTSSNSNIPPVSVDSKPNVSTFIEPINDRVNDQQSQPSNLPCVPTSSSNDNVVPADGKPSSNSVENIRPELELAELKPAEFAELNEVIEIKEEDDDEGDFSMQLDNFEDQGTSASMEHFSSADPEFKFRRSHFLPSLLPATRHDNPVTSASSLLPSLSGAPSVSRSPPTKNFNLPTCYLRTLAACTHDFPHKPCYIKPTVRDKFPQRRCRLCSRRGYRKESRFYCADCADQPVLCRTCYFYWHSQLGSEIQIDTKSADSVDD